VKRIDSWLVAESLVDEAPGSESDGDGAPIVAIRA
jgi:hypothetical protein